jgi:hypothetical protein
MALFQTKKGKILIIFSLCVVALTGYVLERKFHHRYAPPRSTSSNRELTIKKKPLEQCSDGDSNCLAKNEQIKADNLTGTAVEFARRQCDGPRQCPAPDSNRESQARTAIQEFVKDTKLELIRMTGVTPAGSIYYCSNNNRCWMVSSDDQVKSI